MLIGVKVSQWPDCCVSVALLSPAIQKRLKDSGRDAYYARYGKDRDGSLAREEEEEAAR